jgi:2-dehydro-3-deoxyphosphogluconate aldolase/(4S)-4-hydroxy-2-oxoglutarate aldolase
MNMKSESIGLIKSQGVLPLYFHHDADVALAVLRALYQAGAVAAEFTNRGKNALETFFMLKSVCDGEMPGMQLGAGTIKNDLEAQMFLDAGADFLVSPGLSGEVLELCNAEGLLYIPGCMTPTEIMQAEQGGAEFIKLYPGSFVGPGYLPALKDVFPGIDLMPTGGVDMNKENLTEWFKAGASAVGMGGKLLTKSDIQSGNFEQIRQKTVQLLEWIREIRSSLVNN